MRGGAGTLGRGATAGCRMEHGAGWPGTCEVSSPRRTARSWYCAKHRRSSRKPAMQLPPMMMLMLCPRCRRAGMAGVQQ